MAKHHVSAAGRRLPAHPAVFLAITPEIRRALELLAEASISLLDEIDAPTDDLEEDPDFELECEDEGAQSDDEGIDDDPEPNLGWNVDGVFTSHDDGDEDFVAPETSGGYGTDTTWMDGTERSAQRALFDPRIGRRPNNGENWRKANNPIPPFPHERVDRPAFHVEAEIRRLNKALLPIAARRRRHGGMNRDLD